MAITRPSAASSSSSPAGDDDNEPVSGSPTPRIEDSLSPSVGIAAARWMDLKPEKERRRNIAEEEVDAEELRGDLSLYQKASELFVLLHSTLFTNIQLNDFQLSLARLIEHLNIENAEEKEWIMMGSVDIVTILEMKVERWRDEDRVRELEEEKRCMGKRWIDDEQVFGESDDDDENDWDKIKALKSRRCYLEPLLKSAKNHAAAAAVSPARSCPRSKKVVDNRPRLNIVPGYSILVAKHRYLALVSIHIVMELNGLSSNPTPQLAEAAAAALNYVTLALDRTPCPSRSRLPRRGRPYPKAAIWQDEHWVNQSSMLNADSPLVEATKTTEEVVFLSLDRNLRLKARSCQLAAAGEKDLAALLSATKETEEHDSHPQPICNQTALPQHP
ncbi:hypothetical protein BKA70DRAFT_1425898 [Coprinopsis sp. MPI-PUGE-AT-0042]|nr:hypothetical protein BKA70DRAFT_1425898 [Coprinopsis sp. MPI-PUGE-AT-0042]